MSESPDLEVLEERWSRIGRTLFGGLDPTIPNSESDDGGLGRCVVEQRRLSPMISRELDILAHRWYHTVGAPHLSLLLFLFAQADLLELASYKVSEEMFHLGFLAGVASERAIGRSVRLADYDDTVACLASANKGIRTIEMLQESGALPAFTDDELAQIARTKHALRRLIDDLLLHGNDRPGDSPPEEAAS